jgi:Holin of 3TMs, for gene-transfer release
MGIFDGLIKDGVSTLGSTIGGMAKDIRTAITGKEAITADEREKILAATDQMAELALQADQAINQGQIDINKIDAASGSFFRGGWRPAVGWVCVMGLAYQFVIRPICPWAVQVCGAHVADMPTLDMGTLITLLSGMLGLGGFRTYEKTKGLT